MSGCSTWHVRIDLVDDGTRVNARAKLIGAPAAITQAPSARAHEGCLTGSGAGDASTEWIPLAELSLELVAALATEHRAHSMQARDTCDPPVSGDSRA